MQYHQLLHLLSVLQSHCPHLGLSPITWTIIKTSWIGSPVTFQNITKIRDKIANFLEHLEKYSIRSGYARYQRDIWSPWGDVPSAGYSQACARFVILPICCIQVLRHRYTCFTDHDNMYGQLHVKRSPLIYICAILYLMGHTAHNGCFTRATDSQDNRDIKFTFFFFLPFNHPRPILLNLPSKLDKHF